MAQRIMLKGDTLDNWLDVDPVLPENEMVFELSLGRAKAKIGNGIDKYSELPYLATIDNYLTDTLKEELDILFLASGYPQPGIYEYIKGLSIETTSNIILSSVSNELVAVIAPGGNATYGQTGTVDVTITTPGNVILVIPVNGPLTIDPNDQLIGTVEANTSARVTVDGCTQLGAIIAPNSDEIYADSSSVVVIKAKSASRFVVSGSMTLTVVETGINLLTGIFSECSLSIASIRLALANAINGGQENGTLYFDGGINAYLTSEDLVQVNKLIARGWMVTYNFD